MDAPRTSRSVVDSAAESCRAAADWDPSTPRPSCQGSMKNALRANASPLLELRKAIRMPRSPCGDRPPHELRSMAWCSLPSRRLEIVEGPVALQGLKDIGLRNGGPDGRQLPRLLHKASKGLQTAPARSCRQASALPSRQRLRPPTGAADSAYCPPSLATPSPGRRVEKTLKIA